MRDLDARITPCARRRRQEHLDSTPPCRVNGQHCLDMLQIVDFGVTTVASCAVDRQEHRRVAGNLAEMKREKINQIIRNSLVHQV